MSREKYNCEDHSDGGEWMSLGFKEVTLLWESATSEDLLAVSKLKPGETYGAHQFYVTRMQ